MNRRTLLIDAVIAAILALLVIVLSPGWAIVGLIAIVVLLVCGVTLALGALGRRRRLRRRAQRRSEQRRSEQRRDQQQRSPQQRSRQQRSPQQRRDPQRRARP